MSESTTKIPTKPSQFEAWFDDLISTLRSHQVQLETSTANKDVRKFYETIFKGNADEVVHLAKNGAQKHFVSQIIFEYLKLIKDHMPEKLAFDYNDSEVLVWAEVNDAAFERSEKELLKAEAQINSAYHQYGFDMETTIVEAGDTLPIPNHYRPYKA